MKNKIIIINLILLVISAYVTIYKIINCINDLSNPTSIYITILDKAFLGMCLSLGLFILLIFNLVSSGK